MNPKNLKFPLTWEERRPIFHEGIFVVPQYYDKHSLWIDEQKIFINDSPFHIEFCSGNGDWVIEKAKNAPNTQWIAVEKQFERVRKIWSKMQNERVENLIIVCGDAQNFTEYYLPKNSAREIYVNFPDPWPKDRHAKHRLIQAPFIDDLSEVVMPGGKATFATDDAPYSQRMIDVMQKDPNWESVFDFPHYIQSWENYGHSWFETLWREKERDFYYMQFTRKK